MSTLPPGPDDLFEDEGSGGHAPNPVMMVHRALRGRYLLALGLGLALAVPLAIGGYYATSAEYTSSALLQANLSVPAVLYKDEVDNTASALSAFVSQQAEEIRSARVFDRAIDHPDLASKGWPAGDRGRLRLQKTIGVDTIRNANLIIVSATDPDQATAQAAAKAVVDEYIDIHLEKERRRFTAKETDLTQIKEKYRRERDEKRKLAYQLATNTAGTDDLQLAERNTLQELSRIEDQIRELDTLISLSAEATDEELPELVVEDPELARLIEERDLMQRQLNTLLKTVAPAHRQAKQMTRSIAVLDDAIEERRAKIMGDQPEPTGDADTDVAAGGDTDADGSESPADGQSTAAADPARERLNTRLEDLKLQRSERKRLLQDIAKVRLDMFSLQQEADIANERLEDAERRLEALRVEKESQITMRVQISQEPEYPLRASTDRRVPLAGAGFIGGLGFGFVAVAGFGLAFPRVRVADDVSAAGGDFSMLGMIPEFPTGEETGPTMTVREAFHFLRVILDARAGRRCLVCGITSPTAGEGKTTISTRLARSYAASGRRVLLIDADLVGQGTTRELRLTPSQSDYARASLDDSIVRVDDAFDVIPASNAENASEVFCGRVLGDLLAEARQRYDIVLVDTGPILGSIEAAAMTSSMDQILLIVSRGLESRLLKMSTDRLRELNARSVGVVFNRATSIDFNRSFAPPSSTSRRSVRPVGLTGASPAEAREVMEPADDAIPRDKSA